MPIIHEGVTDDTPGTTMILEFSVARQVPVTTGCGPALDEDIEPGDSVSFDIPAVFSDCTTDLGSHRAIIDDEEPTRERSTPRGWCAPTVHVDPTDATCPRAGRPEG